MSVTAVSRRARAVAVYLLLGAVTTALVAWGVVPNAEFKDSERASGSRLSTENEVGDGLYRFTVFKRVAFGATHYSSLTLANRDGRFTEQRSRRTLTDIAPGWAEGVVVPLVVESIRRPDSTRTAGWVRVDAYGWPFRAFWCRYEQHLVNGQVRFEAHGGLTIPGTKVTRPSFPRPILLSLPLRPYWIGFAADTIFWGWAWWTPVALIRLLRAVWRRRHGRCSICGYDLTGIDGVCPECGSGP